MKTTLIFGPTDHGRKVTEEEFTTSEYEQGYSYEIIDGKLYVSPLPNQPQESVEYWLYTLLLLYSLNHPKVINRVSNKARVFIPGRDELTIPEPDIVAYHDFPLHVPINERQWQRTSPILVVEIMSVANADKDLERNMDLYLQVPSIWEYWILDTRVNVEQPTLLVQRRHGKRWRRLEFSYGETYTTRLLPDFSLIIGPNK